MKGSAANLVTRLDGFSFAYAANSREGGDAFSGEFTGLIHGLIDELSAAGAWPAAGYDLYTHVNIAFDAWRNTYFTALDRSQPGLQESVWGFSADPDGDGLENGAEAYFGRDPLVADRSPFTLIRSGDSLTIRWQRAVEDRSLAPIVESSVNLAQWVRPIGVTIQPRNDLITQVGYRYEELVVPITSGQRHYRLRFEPL